MFDFVREKFLTKLDLKTLVSKFTRRDIKKFYGSKTNAVTTRVDSRENNFSCA